MIMWSWKKVEHIWNVHGKYMYGRQIGEGEGEGEGANRIMRNNTQT